MDLSQKITFTDTVFSQEVDAEMVLLDMESENYFGLDEVGTAIRQVIHEKESLQEAFEVLLDQYEVTPEVLGERPCSICGKFSEKCFSEAGSTKSLSNTDE